MNFLEQKVKRANREFYDIVGPSYECIDGRRSERLINYVSRQIESISGNTGADSVLDLGCGSGFIARIAKDYFKRRYALDISFKIIRAIDDGNLRKITADYDSLPIRSSTLNCVVTFATLHHCYSYEKMFPEIYRVLRSGGIYYSDHDMDSLFFRRFKPLLRIYRRMHDAKAKYMSTFDRLSGEIYDCAEFHQEGIPSEMVVDLLEAVGFKHIKLEYHWFGLSSLTDKLFGKKSYKKGYAPLVKIIALK